MSRPRQRAIRPGGRTSRRPRVPFHRSNADAAVGTRRPGTVFRPARLGTVEHVPPCGQSRGARSRSPRRADSSAAATSDCAGASADASAAAPRDPRTVRNAPRPLMPHPPRAAVSSSSHAAEETASKQVSAATSSISPTRAPVVRSPRLRTTSSSLRLPPKSRGPRGDSFARVDCPTT